MLYIVKLKRQSKNGKANKDKVKVQPVEIVERF